MKINTTSTMNNLTSQASPDRDQAAIDRQRSKYQYNNEMPLAPQDYGMPHQAKKKGVPVKPQMEVTNTDGEEDATQNELDGEEVGSMRATLKLRVGSCVVL
jgi:hypothetical protein